MIFLIPPRRHGRRAATATAATLFAVLATLTGPAGPAAADTPAAAPASGTPAAGTPHAATSHTVTLLTGDVVRVSGPDNGPRSVDITRPHGATGGARTEVVNGDLYVYPDEAMPYLAADRLDRRLFDVTSLIEQGYDDQHSDAIPLILGYRRGAAQPPASRAVPRGSTRVRSLPSIDGTVVRAAKKQARQLWTSVAPAATPTATATGAPAAPVLGDGLSKVWLDGKVRADLQDSTAQIGAPAAWAAGDDGKGVKVAVLDTGIDSHHPDLAGRVSKSVSFVPGETTEDGNGHGTHTASTVGGSGAASGGAEKGVAPGADLLVGKVLSDEGSGDDSWVIAGMEWAVGQGARVVSMSLGGSDPSDGTDPMSQAVDRLSAQSGALFVVAAGNTGAEGTMSAPGTADSALTVAAVDSGDQLADFSTRGPRFGDYALKPDIAAPGVDILAAKAGGTAETGWYQTMSGTSMATPHVAGAAAILAQEHPDWTAPRLKDALMSTSKSLPDYTAYQVGAGRVDVAASLHASLTATGSAYFGFDGWPHDDQAAVDRTVTYSNSGDAPVVLKLSLSASVAGGPYDVDPGADAGTPAPDGVFALSGGSVTVPAHGSAHVTATARPQLGAAGRRYLGGITATDASGAVRARTQVGLYKEDERHSLDIVLKDRSGKPAAGLVELQEFGTDADPQLFQVGNSGRLTVRLRAGTYSALTYLDVAGSHGPDSLGMALMGDPEIALDQDRQMVLDASKAREVTAQVPRTTEDRMLYMDWHRSDGGVSTMDVQYLLPPTYDSMFVLPTRQVSHGTFEYETRWRKAYPLLTLTHDGKPLTVLGQGASALYDGTRRLDTVYAGAGAPADYAGLKAEGKAVLVSRSDALTGSQRAQAAADAGAALLVEVDDTPGKLLEWVGTDAGGYSAVPVVSVTAREGAPLIAQARQGKLRLAARGVPNSPYVYDLADPHPGRIPSTGLTYRPRPSELATVEMRFHGATSYPSGEFRWDYRPYRTYAVGFPLRIDMPGTRTDYLSAQPGTTWAEDAVTGPDLEWESNGAITAYKAGSRVTRDWFAPVVHPRNGGGYWWSERQQGFLSINIQPWTDSGSGASRGGTMLDGTATQQFKVFQDGRLVETSAWPSATLYPIPTTPSTYTLDLSAQRDPAAYRLSPRTHTVWQVKSDPVTDPMEIDRMALLQLDYAVDTDLAGDARGGRQTLRLTGSHLPDAAGAGRIAGATLAVSYDDGRSWHPVTLGRTGRGNWTARYDAPRHGFVSLKAQVWDDAGNRITQEVTRAYGLK
ncbi:S8 family serine peptidase [Actinacidiphila paucisporea]|uniref:Serine protease, subtilisin family n=1 Tax=Actinacidiphila paucisporea TaxID=310782 RepID=A0A1M7H5I8_9ACTN|nr:S8 family serine peptidase [Actinacidiphila paucisporea]SHM23217.1 Serine protease, subtilisin family [Actinacidiphila paucisporea]